MLPSAEAPPTEASPAEAPPPQLLRLAPKMCVLLYFAGLVHPFFFQLDPSVPHAYMMTQYLMYTGSLSFCATCWLL